ncbi:MAG: DUF4124 domain-containing protein [bacterium]
MLAYVMVGALCGGVSTAGAQQIYRWTDESGKVHFGNQPPPGTKNVEAKDRERSAVELECEGTVKSECGEYVRKYGKWQDSEVYRDCLEQRMEICLKFKPRAKPTEASERFISTPTLPFDPSLGDSLLCEMRCPDKCRGRVEIRADRVLKKGENYGVDRYAMEVKPQQAGSAFCSVSTPSSGVQLVLSVRRNGSAAAVVEAQ